MKIDMSETQKEFFSQKDVVKDYLEGYNPSDPNLQVIKSLSPSKKVLSLGCGGGREVKALTVRKHQVTAIDFSEEMIKQSKKVEPKAKYLCQDAVQFARENRDKLKFDYILGLFSFLNYIKKEDRKEFISNITSMLNQGGKCFFVLHYVNGRWQDIIKSLISPFYALHFNKLRMYEFGDIYSKSKSGYSLCHHYTRTQIKRLLKGYNFKISNRIIKIEK